MMLKKTTVIGTMKGNGKTLICFEDGSETLFSDTSVANTDRYLESVVHKPILCIVLNDSTKIPIDPDSVNTEKIPEFLYSVEMAFNPDGRMSEQPIQDRLLAAIAAHSII